MQIEGQLRRTVYLRGAPTSALNLQQLHSIIVTARSLGPLLSGPTVRPHPRLFLLSSPLPHSAPAIATSCPGKMPCRSPRGACCSLECPFLVCGRILHFTSQCLLLETSLSPSTITHPVTLEVNWLWDSSPSCATYQECHTVCEGGRARNPMSQFFSPSHWTSLSPSGPS